MRIGANMGMLINLLILIIMAVVYHGRMKIAMNQPVISNPSDANGRAKRSQSIVHQLFVDAGWAVDAGRRFGDLQPELVARRGDAAYAVEIKAAVEGRSDRLVPLLAQAVLQAQRVAGQNAAPLAVVAAPKFPDVPLNTFCDLRKITPRMSLSE